MYVYKHPCLDGTPISLPLVAMGAVRFQGEETEPNRLYKTKTKPNRLWTLKYLNETILTQTVQGKVETKPNHLSQTNLTSK